MKRAFQRLALTFVVVSSFTTCLLAADRPNFLLITYADVSPHFGCYGDKAADTPVIDRLAAEGVRSDRFTGIAAVCAPNRSTLATRVYPTSLGSQRMRTETTLPENIKVFAEYLRDAGYG